MRFERYLILIVFYLIVILAGTELFSRFALGLKPLLYTRAYDPLLVSGDGFGYASRDALLRGVTNGPAVNNYATTRLGHFIWNGRSPPRSSADFADFLFSHYLSRYSSRDMDRIICDNPSALSIFVFGGSVAQGTAASSKLTTWHALLESRLRNALARNDVYVFNGAMGAFLSIQERLAYDLALSSRDAKVVIILNGANDLLVPAGSGTRPGDPFQLGTRYQQIYGDPLAIWLAETSATFNYFFQADLARSIGRLRERLAQDDAVFSAYAEAAVSIYMENMSIVLHDCEARRRECLVAVQPSRLLSQTELGAATHSPDVLPSHRVVRLYELLREAIHASPYASHFVDLTHIVKSLSELAYYTDVVHLDDRGQLLIADALFPATLEAVNRVHGGRESNLTCDRDMPR